MDYGSVPSTSYDQRFATSSNNFTYSFNMNERSPLLRSRSAEIHRDKCFNFNVLVLFLILFSGITIGTYLLFEEYQQLPMSHPFDLVGINYWNKKHNAPTGPRLDHSTNIILIHTRSNSCTNIYTCCNLIKKLQYEYDPSDIPFNFLIGGDGITYEAKGWSIQSDLDLPNRNNSLVVAIIGDFTENKPLKKQLDELEALIRESIMRKKLSPNFTIQGVRNRSLTNDAEELFSITTRWRSWKDFIYI